MMTDTDIKRIVREAVGEALEEWATKYGLNVREPLEQQEDFAFLHRQRKATEAFSATIRRSITWTAGAALASGAVWLAWEAIKQAGKLKS